MIMVIITIKSQGDSDKKKVIESNWLFFKVNRKDNDVITFLSQRGSVIRQLPMS